MSVILVAVLVGLPVVVVVVIVSLLAKPGRLERSSLVAFVTAAVGFVICAAVTTYLVSSRFVPDSYLPTLALTDERWASVWAAGLLGVGFALVGLASGLFALFAGGRGGGRRTTAALAFAVGGLVVIGAAWWFVDQSPYLRYGLTQLPAAERARLDALEPADVVRTYLTARDLSVGYWLTVDQSRERWHNANWAPISWEHYPPWGVLAGIDDLQVIPFEDENHPATDTQRSFSVSYTARGSGTHESYLVVVSREAGGPWRLRELQFL